MPLGQGDASLVVFVDHREYVDITRR